MSGYTEVALTLVLKGLKGKPSGSREAFPADTDLLATAFPLKGLSYLYLEAIGIRMTFI